MSAEKLYDLTQLTVMMGDSEGVKMMLNIFLESTPKILNEINEGFATNDFDALARSAHKLKSSLDMMKIDTLHTVIRQIDRIENVIANKDQLELIIEKINTTLTEVFIQLTSEKSGNNQL
jgi:HPt (histidine-containing phosphotransfer) domain-containing protein